MTQTTKKAKTATSQTQIPLRFLFANLLTHTTDLSKVGTVDPWRPIQADLSRHLSDKTTLVFNGQQLTSAQIGTLQAALIQDTPDQAKQTLAGWLNIAESSPAFIAFFNNLSHFGLLARPAEIYKNQQIRVLPEASLAPGGAKDFKRALAAAEPTNEIYQITAAPNGEITFTQTSNFTNDNCQAAYLFKADGSVELQSYTAPDKTLSLKNFQKQLPEDFSLGQLQHAARELVQKQLQVLTSASAYQQQLVTNNDFAQFQAAMKAGWFINSSAKQALIAKVTQLQQTSASLNDSQQAFLCAYELITTLEGLLLARTVQPTVIVQEMLAEAQTKLARFKNNHFYPQLQALFNEVCLGVYSAGVLPKPLPFFENTPQQLKLAEFENYLSQFPVRLVAAQIGLDTKEIPHYLTFADLAKAAYPIVGKTDPTALSFLQALGNIAKSIQPNSTSTNAQLHVYNLDFLCQAYADFVASKDIAATEEQLLQKEQLTSQKKQATSTPLFSNFASTASLLISSRQAPSDETLATDADGLRAKLLKEQKDLKPKFLTPAEQLPKTTELTKQVKKTGFKHLDSNRSADLKQKKGIPASIAELLNYQKEYQTQKIIVVQTAFTNGNYSDFELLKFYFSISKTPTNSRAHKQLKTAVESAIKAIKNTPSQTKEQQQLLVLYELMSVQADTNKALNQHCHLGSRDTKHFLSLAQTTLGYAIYRLKQVNCLTSQQLGRKQTLLDSYQQSLQEVNKQLAAQLLQNVALEPLLKNLAAYLELDKGLVASPDKQPFIDALRPLATKASIGTHKNRLAKIVVDFVDGKSDQRALCTNIQLCFQENGANLVGFFGAIRRGWGQFKRLFSDSPEKHRIKTATLLQKIANQALLDTAKAIASHYNKDAEQLSSYTTQYRLVMAQTQTYKVEEESRKQSSVATDKKKKTNSKKALKKQFKQEERRMSNDCGKEAAKNFKELKKIHNRGHQYLFAETSDKKPAKVGNEKALQRLAEDELRAHELSSRMMTVKVK